MAIEKLVCSNCKGVLKWDPEDRTFTCENCGTKFQTDNEFTYRIVNEAEIKRIEMEAENKKMEIESKKTNLKEDLKFALSVLISFSPLILIAVVLSILLYK